MQAQRYQVDEGKVYIICNGEPVELPIADGCVYVVVGDVLKPLPKPTYGFGTTEVQYRDGKFVGCMLKESYKPSDL